MKKTVLLLLPVVMFLIFACKKEDKGNNIIVNKNQIYKQTTINTNVVNPQMHLEDDTMTVDVFGYFNADGTPAFDKMTSIIVGQKDSDTLLVCTFNSNYELQYLHRTTKDGAYKDTVIFEFERYEQDPNLMFLNIYDYNWNTNDASLLYRRENHIDTINNTASGNVIYGKMAASSTSVNIFREVMIVAASTALILTTANPLVFAAAVSLLYLNNNLNLLNAGLNMVNKAIENIIPSAGASTLDDMPTAFPFPNVSSTNSLNNFDSKIKLVSIKEYLTELNGCTTSGGIQGSGYAYSISFINNSSLNLDEVEIKGTVINGTNPTITSFPFNIINGNQIVFNSCAHFGTLSEMRCKYWLEFPNGEKSIEIFSTKIRPAGAVIGTYPEPFESN